MLTGLLFLLSIQAFCKVSLAAIDDGIVSSLRIPPCCDPALEPGSDQCESDYLCCPDGSWGCGIIDKPGVYACSGVELAKPIPGIICPPTSPPTSDNINCCLAEDKPTCPKAACCKDGTWTCPVKDGSYLCNDQALEGSPTGKVCSECCFQPDRQPLCPDKTRYVC